MILVLLKMCFNKRVVGDGAEDILVRYGGMERNGGCSTWDGH